MKLVTTLPTEFIRMLPETTSRRRAMSHEEFQRWFKACEQKHHKEPDSAAVMLLMFLGLTGLRLGKLVTFVWRMWNGHVRSLRSDRPRTAGSVMFRV
jgi:integrase